MGIIRGTHSSPGVYTKITINKQVKTRIGWVSDKSIDMSNINTGGNTPIVNKYLTFTALENNCAIGFYNNPDSSIQPTLEYSFDKNTWNTFTEDKVSIPQNTNMYCRGMNVNGISPGYDDGNYNYFVGEGKFNVSGDIMTLINYQSVPDTMVGTFYNLFGGYNDSAREDFVDIVDASNLILGAKTLTSDCYHNMFDSCTSMVYGPQIKAEVLAPFCYYKMFYNCTSLTTAPELPANKLEKECYAYMFSICKSLTEASELPATTLAYGCYSGMFSYCESLTESPELPATTLDSSCYSGMFDGCVSLTAAPELPATTLADYCYDSMFSGCISLAAAPELPATTLADSCYGGMFYNCTGLTTAPELPANELSESCYYYMFASCTSLPQAPELPATMLAEFCYSSMFLNCTSLTTAPELPATTLASSCYEGMFSDCISLTAAPELPATTLAGGCYGGMFSGCISLTAAPELPATTLADYCYFSMFYGCTSLVKAPELPATTLADWCYYQMFYNCHVLNKINCLATDISSPNCTTSWVYGVSSTGTFVKHPSMNGWSRGIYGIPEGWTVEDGENETNPNEYNLVDLGLSVKWADRNVGAENPSDNGLYFSWGNVDGHAVDENGNVSDSYSFDEDTYATTSGGQYTGNTLDAEHDAATKNMGSDWRMPTVDETRELVQNTDHYYIDEDGGILVEINGSKLRSICFVKKGTTFDYEDRSNFIEIPFAGHCSSSSLTSDGFFGDVWTGSIDNDFENYAKELNFGYDGFIDGGCGIYRYLGYSVRGVRE